MRYSTINAIVEKVLLKIIYYSLVSAGDNLRERQFVQSIRSLRRHNKDIPVFLITYGGAPDFLLEEAHRSKVDVREAGSYHDCLQQKYAHGAILASNPTFHKLLSLRHLPLLQASQILYLDCDTFFFQSADHLFETYRACHWYAREEPNSRRSHYGYDRRYLDELILDKTIHNERLHQVTPCNTGVCLMNHGVWWRLVQLEVTYLELAWRLLIGLQLQIEKFQVARSKETAAILEAADSFDRARALPFPSSNAWILEEVAMWLTLGHIPHLTQGFLERELVMQGGEFYESPRTRNSCVLAHYFSNSMTRFFAAIPSELT